MEIIQGDDQLSKLTKGDMALNEAIKIHKYLRLNTVHIII